MPQVSCSQIVTETGVTVSGDICISTVMHLDVLDMGIWGERNINKPNTAPHFESLAMDFCWTLGTTYRNLCSLCLHRMTLRV